MVVAVFFAAFICYFAAKWILYSLVNEVFFGSKKRLQWNQVFLMITAIEGVLLFPAVLLIVYFNLEVEKVIFYLIFVLLLNKILTFYKSWGIFFQQKGFSLQFFLYFCSLEITPLLVFGGLWLMIVNSLKVIF